MKLAVIIPVFHKQHLTDALLSDLDEEVFIIDNGGDYIQRGNENVSVPGENLGWLRGCNRALRALMGLFDVYVLLNNDTRLSPGFMEGVRAAVRGSQGLVGPLYDDVWGHQKGSYQGPAQGFVGTELEVPVGFVDGTCMVIPQSTIDVVGLLDEQNFGQYGWGADFDYGIRVRKAGLEVVVTHRAYLNHFHQGTARDIDNYEGLAGNEMEAGMNAKYGSNWRELL